MTISIEQAQLTSKVLIRKTSQGEAAVIMQDQMPVAELRSLTTIRGPTSERSDVIDGFAVFAGIRKLSRAKR